MVQINREKLQRMMRGTGGQGSAGGGGGSMAGMATQAWVDENYLSIEFFSSLFKAYDSASTPNEIVPNGGDTTAITNIKAMFGFWTEQYLSALGQNSGGGGGGGSTTLAGLLDVAISNPQNGDALIYNATSGKWENQAIGGSTGTLSSIGLVMPTGFSVSPATLTADGSFNVSFATGYALPLAADTAKGVTAYGWGNHATAGYLTGINATMINSALGFTLSGTASTVYDLSTIESYANHGETAYGWGNHANAGYMADNVSFWGQTVSNGAVIGNLTNVGSISTSNSGGTISGFHGVELNPHGSLSGYGGYIDFHYNGASGDYTSRIIEETSGTVRLYGKLQIGNAIIEWDNTNQCLKITGGLYSTSFISALGLNSN